MNTVDYFKLFKLIAPEIILTLTALVALVVDLGVMREQPVRYRSGMAALFSCAGCLIALAWTAAVPIDGNLLNGMLVVNPLSQLAKMVLLVLVMATLLISLETGFTEHIGEYFTLTLLATVGMMFLVSSENLLLIFVALELTSLSLYILTAFNKRSPQSAEAALKYFLFGGMAAAFTLYGLSLIYGLSGSIHLPQIAAKLKGQGMEPLLAVALVMTVIGFGFKIAAVPFHLWAPDAYEGAPTPSAALIASGSKVASFFVFAKVMMLGFAGNEGSGAWRNLVAGWTPLLAVLAVFSMIIGNLAAIAQSNVKRLLAYSAIAHAGYALLGLLANSSQGVAALLYYVSTYALTTVGAFAVIAVVEENGGARISDYAGLSRRSPVLAMCLMVFLLSLAGIPPLAGFFGKFYVFTAAMSAAKNLGLLWLVIVAVAMSAVSLYYYLQILKQAFVAPVPEGLGEVKILASTRILLVLLALGVLILGCFPDLLVTKLLLALGN